MCAIGYLQSYCALVARQAKQTQQAALKSAIDQ